MKNHYFIFSICFFLVCCKENRIVDVYENKQDTIYTPTKYLTEYKNCKKLTEGFTKKHNFYISKFYTLNEKTEFNKKDSIFTFKPFYLYSDLYSNCFPEEDFKSIVLIYQDTNKKAYVYENVLYPDNPNIFQQISPNKKGFVISIEKGNSSKSLSSTQISYRGNQLYVDSIQIESWGFKQYEKRYVFNNLKLKNYSVKFLDSLENNINNN